MRLSTIMMAGALALSAAGASASPLLRAEPQAAPAEVTTVHHKPGHKGGPPWKRQNEAADRSVERPTYREYCRTTYRTEYDPYVDAYVERSVRTCS